MVGRATRALDTGPAWTWPVNAGPVLVACVAEPIARPGCPLAMTSGFGLIVADRQLTVIAAVAVVPPCASV